MIPYIARFGLSRDQLEADHILEDQLLDQYARDCGFEPGDSWVLIVKPDGTAEFTPLAEGEERWCCKNQDQIRDSISGPITSAPPFERSQSISAGDVS